MKNIVIVIAIAFLFSGCLKSESGFTCSFNECGRVAPASEIQSVQSYLSSNGITATQHCSGMFYKIDQAGTGRTPTVCNTVVVTYEGKLTNGSVFDQATSPVNFELSNLITGFQVGIPLLKVGGTIHLYVPPSLGYGSTQAGSIPPNSILIFRVDLVGVQ